MDIHCCDKADRCNIDFHFNPELFEDHRLQGKQLKQYCNIFSLSLFPLSLSLSLRLFTSPCCTFPIRSLAVHTLFSVWPTFSDARSCVIKIILFPTDSPSWCQKSNTDTKVHLCCNNYDFCNLDLRPSFPEIKGGFFGHDRHPAILMDHMRVLTLVVSCQHQYILVHCFNQTCLTLHILSPYNCPSLFSHFVYTA